MFIALSYTGSPGPHHLQTSVAIVVGPVLGIALLLFLGFILFRNRRARRGRYRPGSMPNLLVPPTPALPSHGSPTAAALHQAGLDENLALANDVGSTSGPVVQAMRMELDQLWQVVGQEQVAPPPDYASVTRTNHELVLV
jgi:hypothetical protein